MWTLVVVGLGALALLTLTFALDQAARRRSTERDRSNLQVALLLNAQDEGLRLLRANVDRPQPWWTTTPPAQLSKIDEALSGWATVADHIADGTVAGDVVLHAFGRRIVTMWEDAYTYVEDQRLDLWDSLLDLYVDACEAGHADRAPIEDTPADEGNAVTPDEVPLVDHLPADLLTPLLPTAPVTAVPAPVDAGVTAADDADDTADADHTADAVEADRLADIQAALQAIPVVDRAPAPLRRAVAAADVDGPADLLIDLIGTSTSESVDGPRPRAVHR